jgi:hypothetical protein
MDKRIFVQKFFLNWVISHDAIDNLEVIKHATQAWEDIEVHFIRLRNEEMVNKNKRLNDN